MSRTLVLLRHAKSAWPDDVADHDRPLAGRGRRDAPEAGRWLRRHDVAPQVALVSSARRSVQTYDLVAAEIPGAPDPTVTDDAYGASAGDLLDLVRSLRSGVENAIVVAHNPGIGALANILDDESSALPERVRMRHEFPTSALAVFDVPSTWSELDPGAARLIAFAVPRG